MTDSPDQTQITLIKQDKLLCYAWAIANGKADGQFIYCLEEDKFYKYEDGVWEHIFDLAFLSHVSQHIREVTKLPLAQRKQIIENYKLIKYKKLEEFNTSELLNLQNYMVNVNGNNILKHSADYYSTNQLPYKYDSLAKCELWLNTLHEIFEKDNKKIEILQEFFGYCLTPDVEQKKALLLLGESDTGKSTILFTLRDLLGKSNYSSVPLKYFGNPQYTPMMVNKLANIDADVAKDAQNYEAEFKIITSGEPINCNQKFIETFEFIPKCKIVLAANIFPKITDHSSAFYKRLILLPCNRIFDEIEKNRVLNKELKQELPGILNWAIKGRLRLKERGRFEAYDFMKDAVKELENENNPVNSFFDEHIEIEVGDGIYIDKAELFHKYKEWCDKNKQFNLSHIRFAACVYKKFYKQTPKDSRLSNNGSRIWRNIKYMQIKFDNNKQEIEMPPETDKTSSPTTIEAGSTEVISDINWGE